MVSETWSPRGDHVGHLLQAGGRKKGWYQGASIVTSCAFDILVRDGRKVMGLPLSCRKELLLELLRWIPGPKPSIPFFQDLPTDATLSESMTRTKPEGPGLQIGGVMSKRRDSTYWPGFRSPD